MSKRTPGYRGGRNTGARIEDGTIPEAALDTATQAKVNATQRRNLLVNGDFKIWQRGTTIDGSTAFLNSDGLYCADRWMHISEADDRWDITQQTADSGCLSRYFARFTSVNTTLLKGGIVQILEGDRSQEAILNGTVSLSFRAKASDASIANFRWGVLEFNGTIDTITAGSPFSALGTEGNTPTANSGNGWSIAGQGTTTALTTSWADYSTTGITLTSTSENIAVFIMSDDKTLDLGDYFDIADVQLELGSVVTPYERRSTQEELTACQRYFAKTFPQGVTPTTNVGDNVGIRVGFSSDTSDDLAIQWELPVTMRAAGNVVVYNPTAASNTADRINDVGTDITITDVWSASSDSVVIFGADGTASSQGIWGAHFTVSAELAE